MRQEGEIKCGLQRMKYPYWPAEYLWNNYGIYYAIWRMRRSLKTSGLIASGIAMAMVIGMSLSMSMAMVKD